MKKYLILLIILIAALVLSACEDEVLTYEREGSIIITVTNDEIDAKDIIVYTGEDEADIEYKDDKIIITVYDLLRKVITLSVDGYLSQTVLVKSLDYEEDFTYETSVTFEEEYISLEVTVITEAGIEDIEFEYDEDNITYESKGNIFNFKIKKSASPEISVSCGSDYYDYTFTLTETEINNLIGIRTIMLLKEDYSLIELTVEPGLIADVYTLSNKKLFQSRTGNNYTFGLPKDSRSEIYIRDNWTYYGHIFLTQQKLNENDYLILDADDFNYNVKLNLNSDLVPDYAKCTITEKSGEEYIPIEIVPIEYNSPVEFSLDKEYYLFIMCNDGNIRYKRLDIENSELSPSYYNARVLNTEIAEDDPILEAVVELIDFNGEIDDYSGIEIINTSTGAVIGIMGTENMCTINPDSYYNGFNYNFLPPSYYTYTPYNMFDDFSETFLADLLENGKYSQIIYKPFDLYIHIESEENYEDIRIYNGNIYQCDSNYTVLIEDFSFTNSYFYDSYNLFSMMNGIEDIYIIGDEYHVDISDDY
ncbi:MAG: hypothetical protein ACOX3U_07775 [Christensenellales bacterium]